MRPIILADFVRIDGVKPLLVAQLYDRHGDYQTAIAAPCDNAVLAVQVALEMAEFAGYYEIIDFRTADRAIFAAAMAEPDLNAEILHPSDTAHVRRMASDHAELYRELYPDDPPTPPPDKEEVRPVLTGWRAMVVGFLQSLITKIESMGERENEKV
jgi:hypothetical protein